MNVRLLGVLLMVIGAVFGYYSMGQRNLAKQEIAGMEITRYTQKTNGTWDARRDRSQEDDLKSQRDSSQQQMVFGWAVAFVGLAVALAARPKKDLAS
ncbi:hypothetical protein [Lysobacter terrae]